MPHDTSAQCMLQAELLRNLDPGHELLGFADSLQDSKAIQDLIDRFVPADFSISEHPISNQYERMVKAFDGYLAALREAINYTVQTT